MQILQIDNSLSCKGAVGSEEGCFLAFERGPMAQGCDLRKITGSPNVPVHEILGPQTCTLNEKSEVFGRPKTKVSCLWHLGPSRAHPCGVYVDS